MRLPLIMRRQLAWRTAQAELEDALAEDASQPDMPRAETAHVAALAYADLAAVVGDDLDVLRDLTASLDAPAVGALTTAIVALAADNADQLQKLMVRVGDEPGLLHQAPAWTADPVEAASRQRAWGSLQRALQADAAVQIAAAGLGLTLDTPAAAITKRVAMLQAPPSPHLAPVPDSAASEGADDDVIPAGLRAWLRQRVVGDRLRLTAPEASALLATERGASLAEYLAADLDVSAAADATEREPVSIAAARRAWLRQLSMTTNELSATRTKRTESPLALLYAAASHPPVLARERDALFWAIPHQTLVFPEICVLVGSGRVPGASLEASDRPAVLLVHGAALGDVRVAGLALADGDQALRGVSLHAGDLVTMPTLDWRGTRLDPASADQDLSMALHCWLQLVHANVLDEAVDVLDALQLDSEVNTPLRSLLETLAALTDDVETPGDDRG